MINVYKLALLIIFLSTIHAAAQDSTQKIFGKETIAIHPKAGLMYNFYSSDYSSFQGTVDCGIFTFGKGMGWNAGVTVEKDFDGYQLGLGIGYFNRSGISTLQNIYQSRDQNTGRTTFVTLENKMDSKISYLEFSPEIRLMLKDKFINGPLRFMSGFRVGIPVQKDFDQTENVVSPANATFINEGGLRTTTRQLALGSIKSMSTQFGISAGIENMLKIGEYNYFTQQIVVDYNFNSIVSDAEWKTYAIRLDLGLRFSLQESEEAPPVIIPVKEPEPEIPVVKVETPPEPYVKLATEISSETKLETGNELLATLPVVNSVFFAKNSSEIPANYIKNNNTEVDAYKGDNVEYHNYILPVIAKIIKENPSSRIMLEGATSGSQNEPKGLDLSKARTDAVKNVLIDLGVPVSRISFRALSSPRYPSNQQYPEGIEDNQRVDIQVTDAPLQKYVNLQKYAEIKGNVILDIDYGNFPEKEQAEVTVNGEKHTYPDKGKYNVPFRKRLDTDEKVYTAVSKLNVDGKEDNDTASVNLETIKKESVDIALGNFEALLRFNYNSSDLTEENQNLLKQLIQKLPDGSTIQIIGSADMLGTAEHNQTLASDRAKKTETFIRNFAGSGINIQTTTNIDKFSDATPQGRFLNRSIKIRVK